MIALAKPEDISTENFLFMRGFLSREAAICLEDGKEYLLESRLAPIAKRLGHASVNGFISALGATATTNELRSEVVDAMTTNETLFFRDLKPFNALSSEVIPAFIKKNPCTPFSIWSAASSTGQEAYSIAMMLEEQFPSLPRKIEGTDISGRVLAQARSGLYSQLEINRGLPAKYLVKYFRQEGASWRLNPAIASTVRFSQMNLARPWPQVGPFHVVMLRNVMIYFDVETRREILKRIARVLEPGGYLVLGGSETPSQIDPSFVPVSVGTTTFYQHKGASVP